MFHEDLNIATLQHECQLHNCLASDLKTVLPVTPWVGNLFLILNDVFFSVFQLAVHLADERIRRNAVY